MSEQVERPDMTPEEKKALREANKNAKKAAKAQRAEKTATRQKEEGKKEFKIESQHKIDDEPEVVAAGDDEDDLMYKHVEAEVKQISTEASAGNFTPNDFALTLRRMLVSLGANQEHDHLDNFRMYMGLSHLFGSELTAAAVRSKLPMLSRIFYSGLQLPEAFLGFEAYLQMKAPQALESPTAIVAFLATCWQEDLLDGNDIIKFFSAPLVLSDLKYQYDARPLVNEVELHEKVRTLVAPFLKRFEEDESSSEEESSEEDAAAALKAKIAALKAKDAENSDSEVEIDFGAGGVTIDNGDYESDEDSSSESSSSA
eukprot:GDKK01002318.1.p1 GENE.GDKK01002318.1~~GDKK01002318.1.p1  ORF type:complete len:322 (-),score=124.82 GDKK01002318.1:56-997(-)